MKIVIAHNSKIPVFRYGGTERVIWDLGYELVQMGHSVSFLVAKGSQCSFANVLIFNPEISVKHQIPAGTDVVHFHFLPNEKIAIPHIITIHGNLPPEIKFPKNVNFVSQNHAKRYGADAFVYNGLNWNEYGKPDFKTKQNYVHFLGKAAWRIKNVRGAIRIAAKNKTEIKILGGTRINFKMGFRFTTSKWAKFYGMVGGSKKLEILNHSRALIFPVLWHEPFGLAIIESLYFGCPVIGTKFGALPELVTTEVGFLSNSEKELMHGFKQIDSFNRLHCHEYARDLFNSKVMAENYLNLYQKILNGEQINRDTPEYISIENRPAVLK